MQSNRLQKKRSPRKESPAQAGQQIRLSPKGGAQAVPGAAERGRHLNFLLPGFSLCNSLFRFSFNWPQACFPACILNQSKYLPEAELAAEGYRPF